MQIIKSIIPFFIYLIYVSSYTQNLKTQYFLIDEKDKFIKKQTATNKNRYQGYTIINDNKVIKKYIKSSEINGDDIVVDVFDSLSFTFDKDNDTIVDKAYIKQLNIIKTREDFFKINKRFDETKYKFIFISSFGCEKFIIREVRPVIFE